MARIKICGITNREDARAAADYGADALGFILVPQTPRYVGDKSDLVELVSSVPPLINRVGVVRSPQDLGAHAALFDTCQFYEAGELPAGARTYLYAHPVRDAASLVELAAKIESIPHFPVSALLLDTYSKDKLGGSGETFNWDLATEAKQRFDLPIILAGGLTPENVEEAVRRVQPYAVDVSSGVEAEPGRKDHAKLKAFIRAVQRANASLE